MNSYQFVKGTAEAADGATANATVIAAPEAGQKLRLLTATIAVTVAAAEAGGEVALEDGVDGTRIFEADADAVGVYSIDFTPMGYPLTAATLLNLAVDGSSGTQATARCTAVAYKTI